MARANATGSLLRSPHVQGLAKTLIDPSYRRLLHLEPVLHRTVPWLIVVFLATLFTAGLLQVLDGRGEVLGATQRNIDMVYALAEARLLAAPDDPKAVLDSLPAVTSGTAFAVADRNGKVLALAPAQAVAHVEPLLRLAVSPARMPATRPAAAEAELDGVEAILAAGLVGPMRLAVLRTVSDTLGPWRLRLGLLVLVMTTTGTMLLVLGFAYHWQATRARTADAIYNNVRTRLETALTHGRSGLWNWDLDRGEIYWSDSMFVMLGFEPRDDLMLDSDIAPLMEHKGGLDALAAEMRAAAVPATIDRRFRMRMAGGGFICVRARGELVRDAETGHRRLIGIIVDETEERRFAERMQRSEERLWDAVQSLSEAFVLWDSNNRLVVCNSKFRDLHHLSPDLLAPGTSYEEIARAARRTAGRLPMPIEAHREHGARAFEVQLEDGRWLTINERRTQDGGYVSVGTDITSLKLQQARLMEGERQLRATIDDLKASRQVLERQTQQLAELAERYAEEKVRAVAGSRAKSAFLANMSHELRTPLNAIIGFSQLMERGTFGAVGHPRYLEYCRDIHESGKYLLDFVEDVLEMSRIESGEYEVKRASFPLSRLMDDLMRLTQENIGSKLLSFQATWPDEVVVDADRRALHLILRNLLSNAVKFTPAGGRIGLRARLRADKLMIYVADSGIGIPAEALAHLGHPFEQVQAQFTKSHKGSGLGLCIAKSLTELHGGTLRIRSGVDIGTAVLVSIPRSGAAGAKPPLV